MEARDLLVTPILLIMILVIAYFIRPRVTDSITRGYFFPALFVKIFGAIALGAIYQFYYGSGDTFTYHTYGSRYVWDAFMESPTAGLKLIFTPHPTGSHLYQYTSKIYFFRDSNSYFVVRIASFFDLFTFSSYSATAALFAIMSFVGIWMLFLTFYKQYPHLHRRIAVATLFIPSVVFWGSGILKDTVTIACLGIATYIFYVIFFERKIRPGMIVLLFAVLYTIYSVKVFILQAYLPAVIVWVLAKNLSSVRSVVLRVMMVPFMITVMLVSGYFAILKIGEDDPKYSVENIARTAQVTAYDIRFGSGSEAGSGYTIDIGEWTPAGMLFSAPAAVNVALFRPYLWEVRNPLMAMSALESAFFFLFTIYVLAKSFRKLPQALMNYNILFCMIFSLTFAFATGISTFNFGTLVRYKIPLLPFFLIALILIDDYSNSDRKLSEFDDTE